MRETIRNSVFREPDGRASGLFWLGLGALFLVFAVANHIQLGRSVETPLILGVVFVFVGLAELLPQEKKQVAGGIRIAAVVLGLALIIYFR